MSHTINKDETSTNSVQTIELKPKIRGFLIAYILFSLPSFLVSLLVLVLIAVLILLSVVGIFSIQQDKTANKLDLIETKSASNQQGILVYKLNGEILSGGRNLGQSARDSQIYIDVVASDFASIKKDENIKNVVIEVNTPGGEVFASKILGDQLEDLRNHFGTKKLTFYYDQLVASGGLLATCKTASQIVASKYGQTGSIGVIMTLPNFTGTAQKIGYSETVIKSSDTKDIGNPFRDPTKKEIDYFQSQVDEEFNNFKDCISDSRSIKPEKVKEIANGLVYNNQKAKEYGLVDDLGNLDSAISLAAKDSSLGNNYKVWEIKSADNFLQNLLSAKTFDDITKFTKATNSLTDRLATLEAGKLYAIDENRL